MPELEERTGVDSDSSSLREDAVDDYQPLTAKASFWFSLCILL